MPNNQPSTPVKSRGMPPGVPFIVGTEAAERFSYYGMKGILALYITNVLLKTQDQTTNIIHLFTFANYFMPLLGAYVSDRLFGRYHTILWISLFYCLGHGVLALSDSIPTTEGKVLCLVIGLGLIAFGSGGIKPCVSAFMGDQFKPDQRHFLAKAYAAFYWSINLGSFFSFLIIPWVRKNYGYSWAFAVPGIFMALATFIFWLGTKQYARVPPARSSESAGFFRVFWFALRKARVSHTAGSEGRAGEGRASVFHTAGSEGRASLSQRAGGEGAAGSRSQPGASFWAPARQRFTAREVDAASSVGPILSIFALIPVFWALFDQTFSTWVLQGAKMIPFKLGNYTIGPEEMLSANPALVMILVPILTLAVYPRIGRFATPLKRMGMGMFLAGLSFVVVALLQKQIEAGVELSVLWQIVPYIILTTGEVLLSTTGLEFAFREAAPKMKSTIMGFWNLTVAFGNLLVTFITTLAGRVVGGGHDQAVSTSRFLFYAILTCIVAGVFALISSRYQYRDPAMAELAKKR